MRRDTLEVRLLVWILPIALAVTVGVSAANYLIARGVILGETQKGISAVTEAAAAEVKAYFDQRHADLATIAQSPLFRDHYMNVEYGLAQEAAVYRREIARMLGDLQGRARAYPRLEYLDASGREVCGVHDGRVDTAAAAFGDPDFLAALRGLKPGQRLLSRITKAPWHSAPIVRLGTPLVDQSGRYRGALVFAVSLRPVYESLGRLHLGVSGRSYLAERRRAGPGSGRLMTSEAAVAGTPWSVVTAVDRGDFLGRLAWFNTLMFGLLLGGAAGLVLAISRRVRTLLRPLADLTAATRSYAGGDLEARVRVPGRGEVAVLADSFNVMADRLKARTEDLVQRVRELSALQRMNDAVLRRLGRDSIAEACLEAAVSGLGFESGVLFWVDPARGELRGACGRGLERVGLTDEEIRRRRLPLDGAGILSRAARLREPVVASDGGASEDVIEGRSLCAVPILASDAAVAVLCLGSPAPSLPAAKARGLALFGGAAGLALENARLLEAVVESEARYRTAVENSPHAVVGLDQNLRVTLWNRRAEALFGYQPGEARGRTLALVLGEDGWRGVERTLQTEGAVHQAAAAGTARDGRTLDLSLSAAGRASGPGEAREWFVVMQDETEKNRLQARLVQAEKLTAVGSLVTGIAHELNNPLTVVVGHAELLEHLPGTTEEKEDLRQLYGNALRCRDIVAGLLLFARKGKGERRRLSLNQVVVATLALCEYRLVKTEGVALSVELDPSAPSVAGESTRLQQVLVNVLTNACDALRGRTPPARIGVRTRAHAGGCRVEVEDNGPGVPAGRRTAVFEPFFTTKPAGQGTGLGLSISAEIVREMGGSLRCEAGDALGGARFVADFPPCPEDLPEPLADLLPAPPVPGRRALVVDDEPDVAQFMRRILAEDGLRVEAATDPEAGLALLRRGDFDLLVADVDLGPWRGTRLVEEARRLARPPAVILVTGDVLGLAAEAAELGVPVLAKPFLRTDFLRLARRLLAAGVPR